MKRIFLAAALAGILPLLTRAGGGETKYPVAAIPATLLTNADAVLRMENLEYELKGRDEAVFRNHYAITILNANGDKWGQLVEDYDKLKEISSIDGYLYDAEGRQLRKLKNKDIQDVSGVDDNNLMDDNRLKRFSFFHKVYPHTVEFDVVVRYKNTLFFPAWVPQGGERLAVEQSSMVFNYPADYTVRYKAFNYAGDPVITQEKDRKIMTWKVNGLNAVIRETLSPEWSSMTTMVLFAPSDFEIENYKGNMSSWKEFGRFVYSLTQGRDQLPDAVKQKVHQLTDALTDPYEKIRVLYEYLQKNTRYISIQLGIGGWRPFDAAYVAGKGYGDCKALTNYMYSLLKEAGILSYYTVIKAGRGAREVVADFPSQQFNHVILAVPVKKDTVWLECTSQTLPAGYLGDFTCDRYALMVTPDGGALVRTPYYGLKENTQIRQIAAVIDEEGTLTAKVATRYAAIQQDRLHMIVNNLSKDKVKEILHEELDFPTYDVLSFNYQENKSGLPSIEETLDLYVSNYASVTGKRLFVNPNVMTRNGRKLNADEARKYPVELGFAYTDIDTVSIEIPAGYEPEALPQPQELKTKFGTYSSAAKLEGNKIRYYRAIHHNDGKFPATDYKGLAAFYAAIYKADRNRIVLVKKEQPVKGF